MNARSVLIIGGGLGGLFTGAILAKEGLSVTILEKNATIGGGLQSFRRFGLTFDTGMHVIGGMQTDGNIRKICRYLGIADKVDVKHVDDDCTDKLYFAEDDRYYSLPRGKERLVSYLSGIFPEERENLENYIKALYGITENFGLFNLRPQSESFNVKPESFTVSANAFIARYIRNEKLRSILAYLNAFYGGKEDETPAYIHAIISVLYLNGPSRFVNGSVRFARLLAGVVEKHGGHVYSGRPVSCIHVKDRTIQSVDTADGESFTADRYISAIHPCTLLRLFDDEKAFPKAYRERLEAIPNSYSAFSLYIKVKEHSFPYINHSEYYMARYDEVWHFGDEHLPWPIGFQIMTPPQVEGPQEYAASVVITAPMSFEYVRPWVDTTTGHRGEAYRAWKEKCANLLLDRMEILHPGFRDCIECMESASPLTIRDYYAVKGGSLCGYSKDCRNITFSHVPIATKVSNLLLTGQNNNLHGFCGVPLTALMTAEAILGTNYVLNKINGGKDR